MSRYRAAGFLAAIFYSAGAFASIPASPVAGVVKHLQSPVPDALVFVYGVSDATMNRMKTRLDGSFSFEGIPAGIYDVIAYKTGYYPSLLRLWHQAMPGVSVLAIDLTPETLPKASRHAPDIWAWRDRMPADVLREISFEAGERPPGQASAGVPAVEGIRLARFMDGQFSNLEQFGSSASLNRSDLGLHGALPGGVQYSLNGKYTTLDSNDATVLSSGTAADASLLLATSSDGGFGGTYARRSFDAHAAGIAAPAWEREALLWNSEEESDGRKADLSVTRSAESGFEKATTALPQLFPGASRGYELRGHWSQEAEEGGFGAAILIRRRDFSDTEDSAFSRSAQDGSVTLTADRALGQQVTAGARLCARYREQRTLLAPGGSVSLKLIPGATLVLAGSRRLSSGSAAGTAAVPPTISSEDALENSFHSEESVGLQIGDESDGSVRVSASRQDIGEPILIDFDSDLLLDFGNLYLFDGNRLERITGTANARLFDLLDAALTAERGRVDGRVSSETRQQYAVAGSGGDFYRGQAAITIRPTRTDIACAVRRIRQLIQTDTGLTQNSSDLVRISLGQDLTALGFYPFGMVWRVTVAYETDTSPAPDPTVEDTASLRKRVMGGLSVSF